MSAESPDKVNLALVTQPLSEGGMSILKNYLALIGSLVGNIYFITDGFPETENKKLHILKIAVADTAMKSIILRTLRLLWIQIKICRHLLRVAGEIKAVFFHIGSDLYLLPMVFAKLLGKKTVRFVVGRHSNFSKIEYGWMGGVLVPLFRIIEGISFRLADRINVLSPTAITAMALERYRHKITVSGAQFIDDNVFRIITPFKERKNVVGHIGGLGPRKGALNFARAIPLVLREWNDVEFVIAGPGSPDERRMIKAELEKGGVSSKVRLDNWIPAEEFPLRLNELKIFILASYEEGLPAVLQQAMACGAVPVATAVGGIPDLIKDRETGFLLADNSPATIAATLLKILKHPDLEKISDNARRYIMQEYSYEKSVARCREALSFLQVE